MAWWDSLLSGASEIGGFLSRNEGWIKPVVSAGSQYMNARNEDKARQQFQQQAQGQEQANFDAYQADLAYYDKWMADKMAIDGQNQGAASAAAAARGRAAAAQAAAMNAAAKKEEKNRIAALKRGMGIMQEGYDQSSAYLQPFLDAGSDTLPAMKDTYNQATQGYRTLGDIINSPDFLSKINANTDVLNMPGASKFNPQRQQLPDFSQLQQQAQGFAGPKATLPSYYRRYSS